MYVKTILEKTIKNRSASVYSKYIKLDSAYSNQSSNQSNGLDFTIIISFQHYEYIFCQSNKCNCVHDQWHQDINVSFEHHAKCIAEHV